MLCKLKKVWNVMDAVDNKSSDMLLKLADRYTAMTPEGKIKGMNIMEEKLKLERGFFGRIKRVVLSIT